MRIKEGAKVLIVEDDAVTRLVLRKILSEQPGLEISEAEDGLIAWGLLERGGRYDLCITDLNMPRLDGVGLIRRIREHGDVKRLKVILCTSCRDRETVVSAASLGIAHYIVKPFKKDLVLERVRQALETVQNSPAPAPAPASPPATGAAAPETAPAESAPAAPAVPAPLVKGDLAGFARRATNPPSLPAVYHELVSALGRPDSSIRHVSEVILQDPALTSRLLKLANSAFYGGRSEVATVEMAAQTVGLDQIQQLVLATSLIQSFDKIPMKFVDVNGFWEHSLVCAMASALIGEYLRDPSPQRLFVAGLLHEIGRLMMFVCAPEESQSILERCEREQALSCAIERDVLGFDHCDVGAELMASWGLPKGLTEVARNHHVNSRTSSFSQDMFIVQFADFIASTLQWGNGGEFYVAPIVQLGKDEKAVLDRCPVSSLVAELENRCEALLPAVLQQNGRTRPVSADKSRDPGDDDEKVVKERPKTSLPLGELKPGMEVAGDVVREDGTVLISQGSLIIDEHLPILQRGKITSVLVHLGALAAKVFPPEVTAAAEAFVDNRLRHAPLSHAALKSVRKLAIDYAAERISRQGSEASAVQ